MRRMLEPTVVSAATAQRTIQDAIDGPGRVLLAQQEQVQRALEAPLRDFFAMQAAIQRQLTSPLAAIARTQAQLLNALATLDLDAEPAVAIERLDPAREERLAAQLAAWRDALAALRPTGAQARTLLEAVTYLAAALWFAFAPADAELIETQVDLAFLLLGAGIILAGWTADR